ncbi:MAG TPA: cbb3-type cytochrome c oxidase subunit I [Candidatus Paceibacterota bacterium]|nr:cbb3-type cytochrome c oxidase subunit I [Candidatus Paceibacterota bacterium]
MFGRLAWDQLPHSAIAWGGSLTVIGGVLAVVIAITVTKRWGWLWREYATSLDPKRIGIMYIAVAAIMGLRGLSDAVLMRTQQALAVGSNPGILAPDHFQQIFSAHGTIMIFFLAMGLLIGLINIVLPLQLGSRDVAFPFLNSVSFWLFFAGAALANVSLVLGDFSAAGWLSYPPLSELAYSPGTGVDYWDWSLQIAGIGSLLTGLNFLMTIFTMRAKGMRFMRMPIFAWSVLGSMALVIFAFPILTATLALLELDRMLGMHFFTAGGGGNMMMYVNLIWAWGHPEVYILALPAFGIFSEVVPAFSGRRLTGYVSMVYAVVAIAFLSFIVWLHHFFTMGAGADVNAFFGIMTMIIAVPTGVKMFNWIFTMYRGKIRFTSPMLWFMGFVVLFTMGGVTGVMLAEPPADFQFHNSLFLVAHFHTMIISGVVFGIFAGFTYWFPKIFGFRLIESWQVRAFWSWLIGFILAFGPLYILGFMGATRRLDHYTDPSWQPLFITAGIGASIIILGVIFQAIGLIASIRRRHELADTSGDPWDGRTLEWSIPSPAPFYAFAAEPVVAARDAWWDEKQRRAAGEAQQPRAYADILLPKRSAIGVVLGACAFFGGFGAVWHLWWLFALALLAAAVALTRRLLDDDTEYLIPAHELARLDAAQRSHADAA